jgi:hypothetical protein
MEHRWEQHKNRKAHKNISFRNITLKSHQNQSYTKIFALDLFHTSSIFVLSRLVLRRTVVDN